LLSLIMVWGAFSLADGIFGLAAALFGERSDTAPRWWLIVVGIGGIGAGIIAFAWPGLTAQVLLLFIAAWAFLVGAAQIMGAIALRKEISGEWRLVLSGALAIGCGLVLVSRPAAGALALVWAIGAFAILHGAILILLALRVRGLKRAVDAA
jgi:uncharacterized membrane protein HdeD (DUF308 family)